MQLTFGDAEGLGRRRQCSGFALHKRDAPPEGERAWPPTKKQHFVPRCYLKGIHRRW